MTKPQLAGIMMMEGMTKNLLETSSNTSEFQAQFDDAANRLFELCKMTGLHHQHTDGPPKLNQEDQKQLESRREQARITDVSESKTPPAKKQKTVKKSTIMNFFAPATVNNQ